MTQQALDPYRSKSHDMTVRSNRWLYWLSKHWILAFSLIFGLYVGLPFLAPVLMAIGLEFPAKIIYTIFSFLCHQLPQRSFFLFGAQFTHAIPEIQAVIGSDATDLLTLRRFIGSQEMGWKVAWSDRMVSMFTSILLLAWVWYPLRKRLPGLRWQGMVLLVLPMAIDGFTHLISDFAGIGQGFRDTNVWLAALTNSSFAPDFYAGDAWGSFNSLMRLLTGLLFAAGVVWFGFPYLGDYFSEIKTQIHRKFQRAGVRL